MGLFREDFDKDGIEALRKWSRKHPEYLDTFQEKIGVWHPVCIAEIFVMLSEKK